MEERERVREIIRGMKDTAEVGVARSATWGCRMTTIIIIMIIFKFLLLLLHHDTTLRGRLIGRRMRPRGRRTRGRREGRARR